MPLTALREILEAADFRPSDTPDIRGADPAVRTRYRVGTAGAAALGALGLAAAHVWQLRGGRAQRVAVDLRAAAASLRSARYRKPRAFTGSSLPQRSDRFDKPRRDRFPRKPDSIEAQTYFMSGGGSGPYRLQTGNRLQGHL
jgi:hypothetical protein